MKLQNIFITADDLTGAIDAGACFLKNFNNINVYSSPDYFQKGDGLNILNTNTRSSDPNRAYRVIKKVFSNKTPKIVLKKIDSGFRGNISIEIKAIDESIRPKNIFIIPSIPDFGRITIGGNQYAGKRRIHRVFGDNSENSLETSFIPDIIQTHIEDDVQLIDLKQIRNKRYKISKKVVVFDSKSNYDIDLILSSIFLDKKILFVGSLGLIWGLAKYLDIIDRKKKYDYGNIKKILFICGSNNNRSREQIMYGIKNDLINKICIDPKKNILDIFNKNFYLFNLKKDILITTESCIGVPDSSIQKYLADFVELLFKKSSQKVIAVFGGDTLFNICSRLKIKEIKVKDKISPAVEFSQAESKFGKISVVSKGGSVGDINEIEKIINYFKVDNI